jgi:hypothetical protein
VKLLEAEDLLHGLPQYAKRDVEVAIKYYMGLDQFSKAQVVNYFRGQL